MGEKKPNLLLREEKTTKKQRQKKSRARDSIFSFIHSFIARIEYYYYY